MPTVIGPVERNPSVGQPGPTTRQRGGKALNVWIRTELRDALDTLVGRSRRSLTAEVSLALEEYLTQEGLWPPPPEQEDPKC